MDGAQPVDWVLVAHVPIKGKVRLYEVSRFKFHQSMRIPFDRRKLPPRTTHVGLISADVWKAMSEEKKVIIRTPE